MKVVLRAEARLDLVFAAEFYDAQRSGLGDLFIESLFEDLRSLASQSGIHQIVFGLHRKLANRFPFAIYYLVEDDTIEVVAILDCRREPETTKERLRDP